MAEFSVKVSGLSDQTSTNDLRQVFETAGFTTITDVYAPPKFLKEGFGFVRFSDQGEAQQASQSSGGLQLYGSPLSIEMCHNEKRTQMVRAGGGAMGGGMGMGGMGMGMGGMGMGGMGMGGGMGGCGGNRQMMGMMMNMMSKMMGNGGMGGGCGSSSSSGKRDDEFSVKIGNMPPGVGVDIAQELSSTFKSLGFTTMTDVYVPNQKAYGFVRFSTQEDAQAFMDGVQGLQVGGNTVTLEMAEGNKRQVMEKQMMGMMGGGMMGGGMMGGCGAAPVSRGSTDDSEVSIKVGNIPGGTDAQELRRNFEAVGISSITDTYCPPGKPFGFVRFGNGEDAQAALQSCQGLQIGGNMVNLELSTTTKRSTGAVGGMPAMGFGCGGGFGGKGGCFGGGCGGGGGACRGGGDRGEVSVKVGNLPSGATADDVRQAFNMYGVTSMTDVYVPMGKAFGFLRFGAQSDAQLAMQCQGAQVGGNTVTLELADGGKRSPQEMDMIKHGGGGGGCGMMGGMGGMGGMGMGGMGGMGMGGMPMGGMGGMGMGMGMGGMPGMMGGMNPMAGMGMGNMGCGGCGGCGGFAGGMKRDATQAFGAGCGGDFKQARW